MENYKQNLIVNEDKILTITDVKAGSYQIILIPIDPDSKSYRGFYRGVVLPFINHAKIEHCGVHENQDETHSLVQVECNGGRSTAGLSRSEWKALMERVQAYCICTLEIGYPF